MSQFEYDVLRLLSYIGIFFSHYVIFMMVQLLMKEKKPLWLQLTASLVMTFFFFFISFTYMGPDEISVFASSVAIIIVTLFVIVLTFQPWKSKRIDELLVSFLLAYIVYYISDYIISYLAVENLPYEGFILVMLLPAMASGFLQIACYFILKKKNAGELLQKITRHRAVKLVIIAVLIMNLIAISYSLVILVPWLFQATLARDMEILAATINNMLLIVLLDFFVSGILIWFCAYLYMNVERVKLQKKELLQQQLYIQKLENIQKNMRSMRHDYKNIISGIYLQAEDGDIKGIQKFMRNTMDTFDAQVGDGIKITNQLANVKLLEIKSLLLLKVMEMETMGIDCNLEIAKELENIEMDVVEFNRCLGILIDNAVEEVATHTKKHVDIAIYGDQEETTILVKNAVEKKPLLQKIWEEGYSTKGSDRGIGLASYAEIISNYQNVLKQTISTDTEFAQVFTISNQVN